MFKKKEPVEIVVILDRSGSMASIRDDVIGSFNTFLKEQQEVKGAANLSLIEFDHQYKVVYDAEPIDKVKPLTLETYVPRGSTALNDAIGDTLTTMFKEGPKRAVISIITDGQENSSIKFKTDQIKSMIKDAEGRGWQVNYLAANQDAFAVGSTLGVLAANIVNFVADSAGTQSAYKALNKMSSDYRGR